MAILKGSSSYMRKLQNVKKAIAYRVYLMPTLGFLIGVRTSTVKAPISRAGLYGGPKASSNRILKDPCYFAIAVEQHAKSSQP